ncbi:MAG: arginine--tRNA ligase [Spirochaetes bacterium]|nr:arginine--tRNA ligase [Spirochaetota bacterium]
MDNIKDIIVQVVASHLKQIKKEFGFKINEDDITVELPKKEEYGDYSTPIVLKIARDNKLNPIEIGAKLQKSISEAKHPYFKSVEFYKPGFINFFISKEILTKNLEEVYLLKEKYGRRKNPHPEKILIEFVSANPTGPLNVVSARAATVGDVLSKLFILDGHQITKEYYINDAGRQVNLLAESMLIRIKQHLGEKCELKDEHYHGEYISELARQMLDEGEFEKIKNDQDVLTKIKEYTLEKLINSQKDVLKKYNIEFDNWFHESSLRKSDLLKECHQLLDKKKLLYKEEDKTFFRSTLFGDEKDRVIIREDETPTYFFVDIAYHYNKIKRGFTCLIDLWGPDHDGYIPRMKGALSALDYGDAKFKVVIIQQVNLLEKSRKVQMSKRLGTIVLMEDLINDIGVDASRFFFLHRSISSHLDFDLDLARKQSEDNPVFYVQYAYARICNIFKQAENKKIKVEYTLYKNDWEWKEEEVKLIKKMFDFPLMIQQAAENIQPNLLPNYLLDLAGIFHQFYTQCRVLDEKQKEITQNRLFLSECTRQILYNGLKIMGVTAPERM